ncbi:MAG: ArsR/SmtB family transcription factor [Acidiferrobacterales bacterium]|nr:helix-turn-helix transcriptional regulator [Betaproteobacteria bacterium]
MSNALGVAEIAGLVGEPARANMLLALGDGRALPAGELAACAEVTAQTASGHLAQLEQAGLLISIRQGRHRYYRIASPDVATMLEAVMVVAARSPRPAARLRIDPDLQRGRTCYNHLAGRLGVAVCDALVRAGRVAIDGEVAHVTPEGLNFLQTWGIPVAGMRKHPYCRTCIDWSERRHHLAGAVGIAIHRRCLELQWIEHHLDSRAVRVTRAGRQGFERAFGIVGAGL